MNAAKVCDEHCNGISGHCIMYNYTWHVCLITCIIHTGFILYFLKYGVQRAEYLMKYSVLKF